MDSNVVIEESVKRLAIDLYFKLHKCLEKAMETEKLSCQVNSIIVKLAKSIESNETWYDASTDVWCDYFLNKNDEVIK